MTMLDGGFSMGVLEILGCVFAVVIILLLFTFAEVVRNWVRICQRTTSKEEAKFFQQRLEKIRLHFKLENNSDVAKFCDQLEGIGLCGIALVVFWIWLRNFL